MVVEVKVRQLHAKTSPITSFFDFCVLIISRKTCLVLIFNQNICHCSCSSLQCLLILCVWPMRTDKQHVYRLLLALRFIAFSKVDLGVSLYYLHNCMGQRLKNFHEQQFKGCSYQWSPKLKNDCRCIMLGLVREGHIRIFYLNRVSHIFVTNHSKSFLSTTVQNVQKSSSLFKFLNSALRA